MVRDRVLWSGMPSAHAAVDEEPSQRVHAREHGRLVDEQGRVMRLELGHERQPAIDIALLPLLKGHENDVEIALESCGQLHACTQQIGTGQGREQHAGQGDVQRERPRALALPTWRRLWVLGLWLRTT